MSFKCHHQSRIAFIEWLFTSIFEWKKIYSSERKSHKYAFLSNDPVNTILSFRWKWAAITSPLWRINECTSNPVSTSNIRAVESIEAEINKLFDLLNSAETTSAVWPENVCKHKPVAHDHNLTVLSNEAVITLLLDKTEIDIVQVKVEIIEIFTKTDDWIQRQKQHFHDLLKLFFHFRFRHPKCELFYHSFRWHNCKKKKIKFWKIAFSNKSERFKRNLLPSLLNATFVSGKIFVFNVLKW